MFTRILISALALAPLGAFAQEQGEGALEEVIVTATRREESLQDVPISVATLSDMRLDSLFNGGEDVEDFLRHAVTQVFLVSRGGQVRKRQDGDADGVRISRKRRHLL